MEAISQGELELVRFDTNQVLRELQHSLFPSVSAHVTCHYGIVPALGYVRKVGDGRYAISLHSMFNHPETPELVIRHLLIHELLHIDIPPRPLREGEFDPRVPRTKRGEAHEPLGPITHPAEFWVRERELSPDRIVAMRWIFEAFGGCLKYRGREEGIYVRNGRREFGRRIVRPSIEEIRIRLSEEDRESSGEIEVVL